MFSKKVSDGASDKKESRLGRRRDSLRLLVREVYDISVEDTHPAL